MIRGHASNPDVNMEDRTETERRYYRIAVDAVKRLDEILVHTKSCWDLFQPEVTSVRVKLRETCEKLIFAENYSIAVKSEEFLWRKVYYEVINYVKQHAHRKKWEIHIDAALKTHIMSGIGTYHMLVTKLKGILNSEFKFTRKKMTKLELRYHHSLYKSFIALGDLNRYQADLFNAEVRSYADKYYRSSFALNPSQGFPQNQLGTLYCAYNYGLDSAYHYMRGLSTILPFDGTETNLLNLLERNRKIYTEVALIAGSDNSQVIRVHKFIVCFLRLVDVLYSCPQSDCGLSELCQDMLADLPQCLPMHSELVNCSYFNSVVPHCLTPDLAFKITVIMQLCFLRLQSKENILTSAAIAFLFAFMSHMSFYMLSACHTLLPLTPNNVSPSRSAKSSQTATPTSAVSFTSRQDKKQKMSWRRRRAHAACNKEDSDLSEGGGGSIGSSFNSDIENSDSVDDEDYEVLSDSGNTQNQLDVIDSTAARLNASEELALQVVELALEENSVVNEHEERDVAADNAASADEILFDETSFEVKAVKILSDAGYLSCVKIFCDFLKNSADFLKKCASSSQTLWLRLAALSNVLVDIASVISDNVRPDILRDSALNNSVTEEEWLQKFSLPEDFFLFNFPGLENVHSSLRLTANDQCTSVAVRGLDQVYVRIVSLHHFCWFLLTTCSMETSFTHDPDAHLFHLTDDNDVIQINELIQQSPWISPENNENKKEMMQNMTQLWLKAEVDNLESTVQVNSSCSFSPYIVPHSAILIHHLPSVKQLILAKKFVIVIPRSVLEMLDATKKTSMKAREAIRWLEIEFRRGNRFLRAQKPNERISVSPLKYPKKKDKHMWDTYQILECCNYLCQQKFSANQKSGEKVPIVTFLVSNSHGEVTVDSVCGASSSIDVKVEDVKTFISQVFSKTTPRTRGEKRYK